MVVEDNKEMMHNIIKLCSDIVKFLLKYGSGKYKNETTKNRVYHPIDVINGLIDIDGLSDGYILRNEIIKCTFSNPIKIIQKEINMINEERYKNGKELIDTKNKLKEYIKNEMFDEFKVKNENIVRFCLGNKLFDEIKGKYCYNMVEFKKICYQLKIYTIEDYDKKCYQNELLPPYDYIESGFYRELTNGKNITLYLFKSKRTIDD